MIRSLTVFVLLLTGLLLTRCSDLGFFDPQLVVDQCLVAHGTEVYNENTVSFRFRDYRYTIDRSEDGHRYSRYLETDSLIRVDKMTHDGHFERLENNIPVSVPDSMVRRYTESINSVAYFFQLPLPLNDPAAMKKAVGITQIQGESYYTIAVTFGEEGGGTDYQDEFRYWINTKSFLIDYLAYSYQTEGGGVRLRKALNRRVVDGLLVQDYVNYHPADKNTPLDSLPALFEKDELQELSRIIKEEVSLKRKASL